MAGPAITIRYDDREVQKLISGVADRMGNAQPATKAMGEIVRTSVLRNFEKGGRPGKWTPLAPSTLKRKKSNKILMERGLGGGLAGSISYSAAPDKVVIGTNKVYAAVHHFGGKIRHPARDRILHFKAFKRGPRKGKTRFSKAGKATYGMKASGKAYSINIPARPYMVIQDEDWTEIKATLRDYIIMDKNISGR